MEILGYGTHLIVDGFQAGPTLADTGALLSFLREAAGRLEPQQAAPFELVVEAEDGASLALVAPESHLSLHAYPELAVVSMRVFSRRSTPVAELLSEFERSFRVGRFESQQANISKALPRDAALLERALRGDRQYTLARLDNGWLAADHRGA